MQVLNRRIFKHPPDDFAQIFAIDDICIDHVMPVIKCPDLPGCHPILAALT
jgi:hypothetical protein